MAVKSRPDSYAGKPIVSLEGGEAEDRENSSYKSVRQKVDAWLNSVIFQSAIVVVVLLQVPVLSALLLINLKIIQSPPPLRGSLGLNQSAILTTSRDTETPPVDRPVETAERFLHTINIVVLLLFLIEIVARVAARGAQIHKDKKQILDCGLVMLTFVLYVAFTAANIRRVAYCVGFIIMLRLWRVSRISEGIAECERRKLERTLATHRKAQKDAEEQLNLTLAKMAAVQQEMEVLQQQLKVVQYVGKASPAVSSSGLSKMSEDLVTSDEESERCLDFEPTQKVQVEFAVSRGGIYSPRTYPNGSVMDPASDGVQNGFMPSITSNTPSPAASLVHLVDERSAGSDSVRESTGTSTPKLPQKVNVPDLVEHTQGAEAAMRQGTVSVSDSSGTAPSNNNRPSLSVTTKDVVPMMESPTGQAGDRYGGKPVSQQGAQSAQQDSPSEKLMDGVKSRRTGPSKDNQGPADVCSGEPEMCENGDGGYINQAFEGESTPPERIEVKKVSQVPFRDYGSTTYLSEEGIPMTDL